MSSIKSFRSFLEESASIIFEDSPTGFKKVKTETDTNTKLGFYLYFVEYRSPSNFDRFNMYFGIKYSDTKFKGDKGDSDLFWGSLRTENGKNEIKHMEYWKPLLLSCNINNCDPNIQVKNLNPEVYMTSAKNQNPESLPVTIYKGVSEDERYHPWILTKNTFDNAKKAGLNAGMKSSKQIKTLDINDKSTIPDSYAYRIYVIEDMTKLQEHIQTVLNENNNIQKELKDYFKSVVDDKNYLNYLAGRFAQKGALKYFQVIKNFYESKYGDVKSLFEQIINEKETVSSKIKIPDEFKSFNKYKDFIMKQTLKNPWVLVGTFERVGIEKLKDIIDDKGESYDYQGAGQQEFFILNQKTEEIYIPNHLNDSDKKELFEYMTDKKYKNSGVSASNLKEARSKKVNSILKQREDKCIFNDKNYIRGKKEHIDLLMKAVNDKDQSAINKLKNIFLENDLQVYTHYRGMNNNILKFTIKHYDRNKILVKSPHTTNKQEFDKSIKKVVKLEEHDASDYRSLGFSKQERLFFNVFDFINLFFNNVIDEIKKHYHTSYPGNIEFYTITKISNNTTSLYEPSNKVWNDVSKELGISPDIDIEESFTLTEEENKLSNSQIKKISEILELEKNPYGKIFIETEGKAMDLSKLSLNEDTDKENFNDQKSLLNLKKAIIAGAHIGHTVQQIYKNKK